MTGTVRLRALARALLVPGRRGRSSDAALRTREALAEELELAVHRARRSRTALTLALVELEPPASGPGQVAGGPDGPARWRPVEHLVPVAAHELAAVAGRRGGPGSCTYGMGGRGFAVVLAGLDAEAALPLVDEGIHRVAVAGAPLQARAGLAALDDRCPDAETLLIGADAALHEARILGTGRVVASAGAGTGLRWVATSGRPAA